MIIIRNSTLALIVAVTICTISPCLASPNYDACMNKAGTTSEMRQCGISEFQAADSALNRAWKRIGACYEAASKIGDTEGLKQSRESLIAEERLWIKWKDESCNYWESGFGSNGSISSQACRIDVINQRTITLESFAKELCH